MKRLLVTIGMLLLLCGCEPADSGNLLFANDSDFPVGQVEVALPEVPMGTVALPANGSPMSRGDSLSFLLDPDEGVGAILRVYDSDCETVLVEECLTFSFAEGERYQVTLRQSAAGGPELTLESLE